MEGVMKPAKDSSVLCLMFNVLRKKDKNNAFNGIGYCVIIVCVMFFPTTGCYSQNQTIIQQNVKEGISVKQENNDPYLWDFGKVKENIVLEHEFVFKNESEAVINIKDVNTSCGCTISEVKQKKLSPGESTVIGVKFNSKDYSGPVTQYVYMNTDSLDNPIVRYIIKAEVIKKEVNSP
jgi:hypothetical protein